MSEQKPAWEVRLERIEAMMEKGEFEGFAVTAFLILDSNDTIIA